MKIMQMTQRYRNDKDIPSDTELSNKIKMICLLSFLLFKNIYCFINHTHNVQKQINKHNIFHMFDFNETKK